jgi:dTDP-4-dehydrorhamnose 3,5-epimerase
MKIINTDIKDCYIVYSENHSDNRGFFTRIFCETELKDLLKEKKIVQINLSYNNLKGTFRGMHLLKPPSQEDKFIRCISGSVYDIVLDLRERSNTFLKWMSFELTSTNNKMIYIPKGVAHGFQALENNTQLIYHHTDVFKKENEFGLSYNDSLVNIDLPLKITEISNKDLNYEILPNNFKGFNYEM